MLNLDDQFAVLADLDRPAAIRNRLRECIPFLI